MIGVNASDPISSATSLPIEFFKEGCSNFHGINETHIGTVCLLITAPYQDGNKAILDIVDKKILEVESEAWRIDPMISNPQFSKGETENMVSWIVSANYANDLKSK